MKFREKLRSMRAALIVPAAFAVLLLFFLLFRPLLMAINALDPFQKAGIGSLTALGLLVLQPFACHLVALRSGAPHSVARRVFAGGIVSSALLLFPALILFME